MKTKIKTVIYGAKLNWKRKVDFEERNWSSVLWYISLP